MHSIAPQRRTRGLASSAFTLPEVLVTMALIMLVLGGLVGSQLFGMRLLELTKSKMGASDEARAAVAKMMDEIRAAKRIQIGEGDLTTFDEIPPYTSQRGRAIQIYPTTNYNNFVRYFWDSTDRRLKRTTNGLTYVYIVANSISNEMVFTSEDHVGNVITNNQNNRVIGVTLQFYQLQYPATPIGPGGLYDFYQLRTKITRRTLE
jgi:type II secretory pathway pseudopilin PulG